MGRVKDAPDHRDEIINGLSANMKAFVSELETKFPEIRYTSGKRTPDQRVGNNHGHSHHNTGDALDFGAEHKDVYNYLYNTTEGLSLLNKYGLGIIDETDPETMKKTGATGAHFHIGKDTTYVQDVQNRLKTFSPGGEIPAGGGQQAIQGLQMLSAGIPIDIVTPEGNQTVFVTKEQLEQELARVQATADKIAQSEDRQRIEQKKAMMDGFLQEFGANAKAPVQYDYSAPDTGESFEIPITEIEMLPTPQELPSMPALFNMQAQEEFEDGGSMLTDPPRKRLTPEQQKIADEITMKWLNEHPIMAEGQPINLSGLEPLPGEAYPMMTGDRIFVPQVGTFNPDQYVRAELPADWAGHDIYLINGKPVVVNKEFNKEYFNLYQHNNFLRKDELFPIYGLGRPYKGTSSAEE